MSDTIDQKKLERETEGYKMFMRIATKVQKLEYGKWHIVPDSSDPLRKFTLDRDIGWATLKIELWAKEYYHRGVYNDGRWDFKFNIRYGGLFADKDGGVTLRSSLKVRPRLAKELIKQVNETIIPQFYATIDKEVKERLLNSEEHAKFMKELSKVAGLTVRKGDWNRTAGVLSKCPLSLEPLTNAVNIEGALSYDDLAKMAKAMGWGTP